MDCPNCKVLREERKKRPYDDCIVRCTAIQEVKRLEIVEKKLREEVAELEGGLEQYELE